MAKISKAEFRAVIKEYTAAIEAAEPELKSQPHLFVRGRTWDRTSALEMAHYMMSASADLFAKDREDALDYFSQAVGIAMAHGVMLEDAEHSALFGQAYNNLPI